jgi:hypothetical protein
MENKQNPNPQPEAWQPVRLTAEQREHIRQEAAADPRGGAGDRGHRRPGPEADAEEGNGHLVIARPAQCPTGPDWHKVAIQDHGEAAELCLMLAELDLEHSPAGPSMRLMAIPCATS